VGVTAEQTAAKAKINDQRSVHTEICRICLSPDSIDLLARIDVVGVEQFAHEVCITTLPPGTIRLVAWCTEEPSTSQYREEIAATQTIGGA
jgi:hypothetical protein